MYFQLNDHCFLVEGARKGALYDLKTGKVHSVNRGAIELIKACNGGPIENLLDANVPEENFQLDFLDKLVKMGLGSFRVSPPEPFASDPPLPVELPDEPDLEFVWLEITGRCNNKCLHCYSTSDPAAEAGSMPHERWLSLISEARRAGATGIQLIGGEPMLYPEWRDLVLRAREEGFKYIEIFTNATMIDDSCIKFFKKNNVNIATTIYAGNPKIHDTVTRNPGSFKKTYQAVKKLLAAGITVRIASIIMKANEHEADNIMQLCQDLGVEANPPDVVRPTGRGDDKDLLPLSYGKEPVRPPFRTDPHTFSVAHKYHSCLVGKIAVTPNGDIIPCIFARNQVLGNVLNNPLQDVLSGQPLRQCWRTTKDRIEKCKDCEYRYACSDCRPLAQGSDPSKRWLACSAGCSYNPYLGIWEDDDLCQKENTSVPNGTLRK